jgi:hypothetical protein
MLSTLRDTVFFIVGIMAVILLSRIYDVLARAEHINERVNANVMAQINKPVRVQIDQDHPLTMTIDNDVLNMKVQK